MTDTPPEPPQPPSPPPASRRLDMGVYAQRAQGSMISTIEVVALVLSLLWLAAVSFVFLGTDAGAAMDASPLGFVMTIMAVFLPVALIWVAASAARTARTMREESSRLQAAIDAMRNAYVEQQQMAGMSIHRSVEEKIDSLAQAQQRADAAIAGMTKQADAPVQDTPVAKPAKPAPVADVQPALALGTPADDSDFEPMSVGEIIKAVNFPENENDKEGFRTLRRALKDRGISRLVNASQDVLTLMSQDGVYMDDLVPDRAKPDAWRMFADGERGRAVAALGGIRDRSSLALCAGRMRSDPVFKDAVHHFLRQFDRTFAEIAPRATDVELSQFANTRTARAFMLLGRVTGTFD